MTKMTFPWNVNGTLSSPSAKKATLTRNVKNRITQEDLRVKFPWYKNQVRTFLTIFLKTLKFKSRCKLHKQMQKTIAKHYPLKGRGSLFNGEAARGSI